MTSGEQVPTLCGHPIKFVEVDPNKDSVFREMTYLGTWDGLFKEVAKSFCLPSKYFKGEEDDPQ